MVTCMSRLPAFRALLPLALCLGAGGCSSALEGQPYRYDPGAPELITGVVAEAGDGLVTLSWTPDARATSYNIYYASALTQDNLASEEEWRVTKANGVLISVTTSSHVVTGLDNNVPYYFIVAGHNGYHGEGPESAPQVAATPGPATRADLVGTWYFHTLVTGEGARWERGVLTVGDRCKTVDEPCSSTVSEFAASDSSVAAPQDFGLSVQGDRTVSQSGDGAWPAFHGGIGSRKNMIVATWSPTAASRAMTIFQKVKEGTEYGIADLSGTGKAGNGPTLFVGIDIDGLVREYLNEGNHDVVFTGRMTADRTVVVGVSTRTDAGGADPRHFLRIEQLCFKPADQALPAYTLADLAASYRFHELSASGWAHGTMTVTSAGETTFSEYADSGGNAYSFDGFRLYSYPDNGLEPYSQFANFATAAQEGDRGDDARPGGDPVPPPGDVQRARRENLRDPRNRELHSRRRRGAGQRERQLLILAFGEFGPFGVS
jgi:hypothetical protein